MLEQQGRVIALNDDDTVWVVSIRQSACGGYQKNCMPENLQQHTHNVLVRVGGHTLHLGDIVVMAIAEHKVWQALLGLYGLPLVAIVLGSIVGQQLAGERGALWGCVLALSSTLWLLRHITHQQHGKYLPIVIKKLSC